MYRNPKEPDMETRTRTAAIVTAAAVTVLAGVFLASRDTGSTHTFTLNGVYALTEAIPNTSGGCTAANRFGATIRDGAPVRVLDPEWVTVGSGTLAPAAWMGASCEWRFTVPNVPVGQGVYRVVVGDGFGGVVAETATKGTVTFLNDVLQA